MIYFYCLICRRASNWQNSFSSWPRFRFSVHTSVWVLATNWICPLLQYMQRWMKIRLPWMQNKSQMMTSDRYHMIYRCSNPVQNQNHVLTVSSSPPSLTTLFIWPLICLNVFGIGTSEEEVVSSSEVNPHALTRTGCDGFLKSKDGRSSWSSTVLSHLKGSVILITWLLVKINLSSEKKIQNRKIKQSNNTNISGWTWNSGQTISQMVTLSTTCDNKIHTVTRNCTTVSHVSFKRILIF